MAMIRWMAAAAMSSPLGFSTNVMPKYFREKLMPSKRGSRMSAQDSGSSAKQGKNNLVEMEEKAMPCQPLSSSRYFITTYKIGPFNLPHMQMGLQTEKQLYISSTNHVQLELKASVESTISLKITVSGCKVQLPTLCTDKMDETHSTSTHAAFDICTYPPCEHLWLEITNSLTKSKAFQGLCFYVSTTCRPIFYCPSHYEDIGQMKRLNQV